MSRTAAIFCRWLWLVNPDLLWRRKWARRLADEALRMSQVSGIENGAPPLNGFRRQAVMHHSGSEEAQS